MNPKTITVSRDGTVGIIGLNRPNVLNAINRQMTEELIAALEVMEADEGINAIVLHGHGRAFSAGFDMKESSAITNAQAWRDVLEYDFGFIMRFWDCAKPTVAAINGHCLGGAFELALTADASVAGESAIFGEPEIKFGGGIVALLVPWFANPKNAKELLLAGNDRLGATEALRLGFVNRVVADDELFEAAMAMARRFASVSPEASRATKASIHRGYDIQGFREALKAALDQSIIMEAVGTAERREFSAIRERSGLKAALEWLNQRSV